MIGTRARGVVAALFAVAVCSLVFVAGASADVTNGNFDNGTLDGWTAFVTPSGLNGGATVASFDTTGSGVSPAAQFNVGRCCPGSGFEGGGIFQNVTTGAGTFDLSADVAALAGTENLSCGFFELLVDGAVVDSYDTTSGGFPNPLCPSGITVRATLSATGLSLTAGAHEIRIRITRPFPNNDLTPRQYVDNVTLTQVSAAPATCADPGPGAIVGTGSSNILIGTDGDDVIVGLGGSDIIRGGGGNDLLCGGPGSDIVYGGDGDDSLYGGDGSDILIGEAGNDTQFGEAGNDILSAGAGTNMNDGGTSFDVCSSPTIGPGCP
jgi:Ca2+-binding RTX toxin-like protein